MPDNNYEHMQGTPMDVQDHPSNTVSHPEPGLGGKMLGIALNTAMGNPIVSGTMLGVAVAGEYKNRMKDK